ncbi:MAG TPA: helix-turn-helix domain-containing protein [Mycobacterium sp.]|nr:helix-turn-helix domain-containing protein [Mycobacterium sp.]
MKSAGHNAKAIAKYLGVSRATLYRYLGGRDSSADGSMPGDRTIHGPSPCRIPADRDRSGRSA